METRCQPEAFPKDSATLRPMNPLPDAGPTAPANHVDLDRHFSTVARDRDPESLAIESYSELYGHVWGGRSWPEILKSRLVVVLGEPGSGKTAELRQQAARLRATGETACFLRLDEIANLGWDAALSPDDRTALARWQTGQGSATLFLDSVDESKMRQAEDFYRALRRTVAALGSASLRRARFVLSSRISEWHPETDGAEVIRLLAVPSAAPKGDKNTAELPAALELVQLQPLDRERIGRFAAARGVNPVEDFLTALERAHAWEFARRPLDVTDLAAYWIQHNRLGSLTELLEFSITRNLRETPAREKLDPLTLEQARAGAEDLAAAAVVCRTLTFRIPDGNLMSDGLDARSCLPPSWTPAQISALLSRPIFDSASYGHIRFHHRRLLEFLAAAWLRRHLAAGAGLDELEQLCFARNGDQRILRTAFAPVAAWLCAGAGSWQERFRTWVLDSAPSIHLRFGDPAALDSGYRRRLFAALSARGRQRGWLGLETSRSALGRLVTPELVPEILSLICDRSLASDLRTEMLQALRFGRAHELITPALSIIADPEEPGSLRITAAAALRDLEDEEASRRLRELLPTLGDLNEGVAEVLLDTLSRPLIDPDTFAVILERTLRRKMSQTGIQSEAAHLVAVRLQSADAPRLLAHLVRLLQTPPLRTKECLVPVSDRYSWVADALPEALLVTLRSRTITPADEQNAVAALLYLEDHDIREYRGKQENRDLHAASLYHPSVRRLFFWRRVEIEAERTKLEVGRRFFGLTDCSFQPDAADFAWLLDDAANHPRPEWRPFAVTAALDAWHLNGRSPATLRRLRAAVKSQPTLLRQIDSTVWRWRFGPWRYRWHQLNHHRVMLPHYWKKARAWILRPWWRWHSRRWLRVHLKELRMGGRPLVLHNLAYENSRSGSRWAIDSFEALAHRRGPEIAEAVRTGCKTYWRTHTPLLPHEKPEKGTMAWTEILGLTGLLAAHQDGELDFARLPVEDAVLAARYSVHEMNEFPPWFANLASHQPTAAATVLHPCLEHEWQVESGEPETIRHLAHGGEPPDIVVHTVLDRLNSADPRSSGTLLCALRILLRRAELTRTILADLARLRLAHGTAFPVYWFAAWLRVDAVGCLPVLENRLLQPGATELMTGIGSILQGDEFRGLPASTGNDDDSVSALRRLAPLFYRYLRHADDRERFTESIEMGPRDYAERFRDSLFRRLVGRPGGGDVLRDLAEDPDLADHRDWLLNLLDEHLALDVGTPSWTETDFRLFADTREAPPNTDSALFGLVVRRLVTIKHEVEGGDRSPRDEVRKDDREKMLRRMLGRHLQLRSNGHYQVVEEDEVDRAQRPDLRVVRAPLAPVPIEVKLDDTPLHKLLERLENQLVGQYLRDERNNHGIFLVGRVSGQQRWQHGDRRLDFAQMVAVLEDRAAQLTLAHPRPINLRVIAIDFRPPEINSPHPRSG